MATFEEVAELASDINQKLATSIEPDSLVFLIEEYIEDEETQFSEIPIGEIAEQVHLLLLLADAFVAAQDGETVEGIEELVQDTATCLGLEEE